MLNTIKQFIGKGYKLISYIAILFVLIFINFYHIFGEKIFINIIGIIIGTIVLILINKFIINKLSDKSSKRCIIVLLILFLILSYLSVYYFRVKYNWDFKWIMDSAKEIANTGSTVNGFYFKIFPNNWGALIVTTLAMKLFFGSEVGAYIINIAFIFASVIFAVLSAKKIGGNKLALNTLILLIGCAPLYLYAPIVYTDTLSLAFPIGTFYFWLVAKENKGNCKKKYYINLILMTLMGVIGYCIKPVAAIVLIAIILDAIFTKINKNTVKSLFIILAIFIVLISLFNKFGEIFIIKDSRKNDYEFPITHWIMMGLNKPESEGGTSIGYGAYSQDDADYTSTSGNYNEKKNANILKIKERLNDFGVSGYMDFLSKKFKYVWNDETYYSINLIGWDTLNKNSIPYKFVIGDESYIFFRPYMRHFNNTLFAIIIIGIIIDVFRKEKSSELRILGISVVGIAIFLLIWEARSRYVYFLIPTFCILGALGIYNIEKITDKYTLKIKNQLKQNKIK